MKKFIVLFFLFSLGVYAQQKVMTPEMLWKLGRVSLDAVSEDGESFIYGVTNYDIEANKGNRDLYLMKTSGGDPVQLTDLEGHESGAQFVGDKIGFSHNGQFYLINSDGTEMTKITEIEGGIAGVKAYPQENGNIKLLFTKSVQTKEDPMSDYPNLPKAEFRLMDDLMYRHWDSWDDYNSSHLCVATHTPGQTVSEYKDIMEDQIFSTPVPPFGGPESYTLSPDGMHIVYESKKLSGIDFAEQTNSQLYMYNLENGFEELLTKGMMGYDKNPVFSPDGTKLAWLSMKTNGYESDVNDLVVMDMESRKKTFILETGKRYDDLTFHSFNWASEDEIYGGVPVGGSNHIFRVELDGDEVKIEKVTDGDHNYNHFEIADDDLLVVRQDMNHANEIYWVDAGNGKAKQLTHVNDDIYNSIGLSNIEKRYVSTTDGKEMLTWVIYPPNFDPEKKYPTLLYCQGGPQAQVSQFYSFRWNFQLMAARGYIVVAPNRRGLPGFGREWNEQISGDWGGQAMDDYLSAIDEVAQEPFVDNANLGCVGASYGGYSVYMLAGIHEGRFDAFISHCGLFDLESWYLSTEEMFFANYDLGGPFWEEENTKTYERFDPKDYVDNWDTPILVIHGGKDFRVPENQGMEAYNAAQLRGIPSKFLYFPNEGHWILSPQNGLVWHDQFFTWLDNWLKN